MSDRSVPSLRLPPRLVVTDLDGTLLQSDGSVSDRTRGALRLVAAAGVPVVFATGRPPRWLAPVGELTGHRGIAVCSNGAIVYDMAEDLVLDRHALSPEVGREIIAAVGAALPEAAFGVELGRAFRHEASYPIAADYGDLTLVPRHELFDGPAVKLLIRDRSYDSDSLLAKVREIVGDVAEITHSGDGGLLEIASHGVSKAGTLAAWSAARGIDAADVVAFGDMPNDLGMLAWAGRPYAMGNAHPDVRAAVRRLGSTCPSNDEDGVAVVLEELFAM